MSADVIDRRVHLRHPLSSGCEFHHEQSGRTFAGRSVDISSGGMLMYIPASAPLKVGQSLTLKISKLPVDKLPDLTEGPVQANVVRVDRHALLTLGHVAVGLKFA